MIPSDKSKKLNQVTMTQIVSKKHWVTDELQGTDMSSTNKGAGTYNSKKGCYMNGKIKIWKSLLGENHLLGKPIHFSVKNTSNNADTWGFIQQFFQQIQKDTSWLRSRQHKFSDIGDITFRQEEYGTGEQFWNTSWAKSRQHKFTDIGNSIFC